MSGTEIIFEAGDDEVGGGCSASAPGIGIHTEGGTLEELRCNVRGAVDCYFDEGMERPRLIRLHYVRDEVLAGACTVIDGVVSDYLMVVMRCLVDR